MLESQSMLESTVNKSSDFTNPSTAFEKVFKSMNPTRSKSFKGNLIEDYDVQIYTDGSKMISAIGSIIFSDYMANSLSLSVFVLFF